MEWIRANSLILFERMGAVEPITVMWVLCSRLKWLGQILRLKSSTLQQVSKGFSISLSTTFSTSFLTINGQEIRKEVLVGAIATRCNSEHPIECVVINACESKEIAKAIKDGCKGVKCVISWKTEVDDKAAKCFSETFYKALTRSPPDSLTNFSAACEGSLHTPGASGLGFYRSACQSRAD